MLISQNIKIFYYVLCFGRQNFVLQKIVLKSLIRNVFFNVCWYLLLTSIIYIRFNKINRIFMKFMNFLQFLLNCSAKIISILLESNQILSCIQINEKWLKVRFNFYFFLFSRLVWLLNNFNLIIQNVNNNQ